MTLRPTILSIALSVAPIRATVTTLSLSWASDFFFLTFLVPNALLVCAMMHHTMRDDTLRYSTDMSVI
jgi:hypothetical protein